jgi:hypothetical protein
LVQAVPVVVVADLGAHILEGDNLVILTEAAGSEADMKVVAVCSGSSGLEAGNRCPV